MPSFFKPNPNLDNELKRERSYTNSLAAAAKPAADAAKSFAPVGTIEHTTKAGYTNKPGDYKRGIKVVVKGKEVFVSATDWKSHWIEWGSVNNSPSAPLRRGVRAAGLRFKEGR